tara:strand:+ start:100 stop:351 length:252 start_codon:yes stop_codon:yes gene_type:complete
MEKRREEYVNNKLINFLFSIFSFLYHFYIKTQINNKNKKQYGPVTVSIFIIYFQLTVNRCELFFPCLLEKIPWEGEFTFRSDS